jgi:hypothetical protein
MEKTEALTIFAIKHGLPVPDLRAQLCELCNISKKFCNISHDKQPYFYALEIYPELSNWSL